MTEFTPIPEPDRDAFYEKMHAAVEHSRTRVKPQPNFILVVFMSGDDPSEVDVLCNADPSVSLPLMDEVMMSMRVQALKDLAEGGDQQAAALLYLLGKEGVEFPDDLEEPAALTSMGENTPEPAPVVDPGANAEA